MGCLNFAGFPSFGRPLLSFPIVGAGGLGRGSLLMGLGAQAQAVGYLRVGTMSLH